MKGMIAPLLLAAGLMALIACGGEETVQPTAAATQPPTATQSPTATTAPTNTPRPTPTVTPFPVEIATATPEPATPTPEPTATPPATATPQATAGPTATPTPEPTETPAPTPTPAPVYAFATGASSLKLVPSNGAQNHKLGSALALDSGTAITGAPGNTVNGTLSGSAYVFVEDAGVWTQQAILVPNDGASGDQAGLSVAISGDTAVIGAPNDTAKGTGSGSVYVFVRSGGAWTQQARLNASDGGQNDQFGRSVAVNGDTIVAGAPTDTPKGTDSGSAYVFVRDGDTWTEQAKLTSQDGALNHFFGWSVAVEGNTIAVGAYGHFGSGTDSGAVYTFQRSEATWTQQAKLTAGDATGAAALGRSVDLDGDYLIGGAPGDNRRGTNSGAAYIFVRSGDAWTQQAKLTASDASQNDQFGWSASISGDKAVMGAFGDSSKGTNSGSAYVFVRSGESWTQQANLIASDTKGGDKFGQAVAIHGTHIVSGSPEDTDKGTDSGSADVFTAQIQ